MIDKAQFTSLFDNITATEFPKSELAWEEIKEDVISELYSGNHATTSSEEFKASFGFGPEVLIAMNVMKVVKAAVETFLLLKKAYDEVKKKSDADKASENLPDKTDLSTQLSARLAEFLAPDQAIRITNEVIGAMYQPKQAS